MIRINNRTVGRLVELSGNRIRIGGLKFSVDSPGIDTAHKSTLFFGLHEIDERALVERWLPKSLPVVEFGGGLGVVSCMANRLLERPVRSVVRRGQQLVDRSGVIPAAECHAETANQPVGAVLPLTGPTHGPLESLPVTGGTGHQEDVAGGHGQLHDQ